MDYNKIEKKNYTLHVIDTNRFKTVKVSIRFTKKYDTESFYRLHLLNRVMAYNGSKKYPKASDISKRLEYLYGTSFGTKVHSYTNNMVFEVETSILNPRFVKEDLYKDVFEVISDVTLNPTVKKNKFNDEIFEREKKNYVESIMNVKDSPDDYASLLFREKFYKDTSLSESAYRNIDYIKSITNEDIYKEYKKLFTDYKIDVFVLGDKVSEDLFEVIDKYLSHFKQNSNYEHSLMLKIKPSKGEYKESYNTSQSILFVGLNAKGLTDEEFDSSFVLYNTILGSMNNSLLFVNVREKHSLCYYISSSAKMYTSDVIIVSGINKKSYKKALDLINKTLESMKDEKVVKKALKNAKKTINLSLNAYYESTSRIINTYYVNQFGNNIDIEKRRESVNKATAEDVVNVAKKISASTIFMLEGSINEEN